MSDIKKDYFEEGQKIVCDRQGRTIAVAVNPILGEQGKILLAYLEDLRDRGIEFHFTEPAMEEDGNVIINLMYSLNNANKGKVGDTMGKIVIDKTDALLISPLVSSTGMTITLAEDPDWAHTLAVQIAAKAILNYGIDRKPKDKPAAAPEVTG